LHECFSAGIFAADSRFGQSDETNAELRALAGRGPGLGDVLFDNKSPGTFVNYMDEGLGAGAAPSQNADASNDDGDAPAATGGNASGSASGSSSDDEDAVVQARVVDDEAPVAMEE
jgi:hypothetical protein